MDQIRKALAWLKQYHFWVLSVLVTLIGLFCWWSASKAMSAKYKESESQINSGFQQVGAVQSDPFHPNDNVKQQQTEEIGKLVDEVGKLWQQLYDLQRKEALIWPSGPTELKPEFVKTVEKLEFGQEIEDSLREHYQNYIFNHFPKLPEKVGARAIAEGQAVAGGGQGFSRMSAPREEAGGAMTSGGELADDGDYICEWATEDQSAVRAELEFPQIPSSLRVWLTQENLWVYHTLLNVIDNTNEAANATRISNAAVRRIYSLQVGQTAAPFSRQPDRIFKKAAPAAAGETMAEPGPGGAEAVGGAEAGFMESGMSALAEGGTGAESEAQEQARFLSHRYLGEDGKPIPFGGGAEAAADPADPSAPAPAVDLSAFGKEYKRLPVRMVLEMDQRYLPKLIAECANQPLQIEVQEVRVNAGDLLGAGGGGGRMSFSESGGAGGGMLIPDLAAGLQQFNPQPQMATVAIQGVIYIFIKPNMDLLKPPGEEGAADASVALQ